MGEESLLSGQEGEKVAREILKLIGWGSVSGNVDIDCALPRKHKQDNKSGRGTHGVDLYYSYPNPLYHGKQDIVIGSVKHFKADYPNGKRALLSKHLQELATVLDCSRHSDQLNDLIARGKLEQQYKGLLFWLSSSESQRNEDVIKWIDESVDFGSDYVEDIYVVDNRRARFLVSALKTAESYMKSSKIRFIYQNTGKNMDKDQLRVSGSRLPVQLINSEILPIIKEEHGKISCLIFCANGYSRSNLSRLIWFSHKLCGLTNEIRIYFPDYNNNKISEVNGVKQTFQDENLTTKISVHRMSPFDFISLKEQQNESDQSSFGPTTNLEIEHSTEVKDDIEKVLPYGDMLLPKLKTGILSEYNLWSFLMKKGIVTIKKTTKDDLLPVFSCLLLSPTELDRLKAKYQEKEDKPKEIERRAFASLGEKTLWEVLNDELRDVKGFDKIKPPKNCSLVERPLVSRVDSNNNHVRIQYKLEKQNTNKDFLTGKSYHDAEVQIKYEDNELITLDIHTSGETYNLNKRYTDRLEKHLKKNAFIDAGFTSIRFLDFNNYDRIAFFISFFKLVNAKSINVTSMTIADMKFRADETVEGLPPDLESLKGRVSNLNLHGKDLDSTIYLSDDEYREAIMCEKVRFYVRYNNLGNKGACLIELSFTGALRLNGDFADNELRISITPTSDSKDDSFGKSKVKINREIGEIKAISYKELMSKATESPAT